MLLEDKTDLRGSKLLYKDLYEEYVKLNNLKFNTTKTYKRNFNLIKKYFGREDFSITEITDDVIKDLFIVQNKQLNGNTIRLELQKIITIFNFAISKGLIDKLPTEGIDVVKKYFKRTEHHQCFLETEIQKIFNFYNENKETLPQHELITLEAWICSFTLFGLAPVDLFCLNLRNLKDVEGVISIHTTRRKTHAPVNVQLIKESHPEATEILQKYISTANLRGGYIFPCLDGTEKDDTELIKKTSNFNNNNNRNFENILKKCGIKSDYNMYSARHSFATMMLRGGLPLDTIATALGRKVDNIGCYLANLTKEQDLQEVSNTVSMSSIMSRLKKTS